MIWLSLAPLAHESPNDLGRLVFGHIDMLAW
ncbi:MAG: hypothetical protein ACI91B_004127, partial [Planctomycetota bacterium]